MATTSVHVSELRPSPPPLWFVSDGDRTVGPVNTNLLLRGVAADRVPGDCWVRGHRWARWRALGKVREIAALRRAQRIEAGEVVERSCWKALVANRRAENESIAQGLRRAADPGEVLLFTMNQAMSRTGSKVGAIHRPRPPRAGYVTAYSAGPGMHARLGRSIPVDDPALSVALGGRLLCEPPNALDASGAVGDRLGHFPASRGVVMVPMVIGHWVYAVLELGRDDHPFRRDDLMTLRRLVGAAATELEMVQNRL